MESIKIIAIFVAKEENRQAMHDIIVKLVNESRKEEGCISYDLHCDIKNPNKFVILEHWKSQEDINKHNETPHFKALRPNIEGMFDNIDVTVIKQIH